MTAIRYENFADAQIGKLPEVQTIVAVTEKMSATTV